MIAFLFVVVAAVSAIQVAVRGPVGMEVTITPAVELVTPVVGTVNKAGSWCPTCVKFVSEALNELLQVILNGGVLGSCGALCSKLPSHLEQEVCNVLCDIVGIEGFIHLLQDVDPDPIYICEEIDHICPVNDHAKANITALTVQPAAGPQGTTFNIDAQFRVSNTIGTGEAVLQVGPPNGDGQAFGDGNLLVEVPPGLYNVQAKLTANPSKQEPYNPGLFHVAFAVCEGTCGSIHPHTYLLSNKVTTFTIN